MVIPGILFDPKEESTPAETETRGGIAGIAPWKKVLVRAMGGVVSIHLPRTFLRFGVFLAPLTAFSLASDAQNPVGEVSLAVGPRSGLEITKQGETWTIRTTGGNPHFWTGEIPGTVSRETHPILAFEYFSTEPISNLRVRLPLEEKGIQMSTGTVPLSEAWRQFGIDLRLGHQPFVSGKGQRFALILGTIPGHEFQLRNLRLRPANAAEQKSAEERSRIRKQREGDAKVYLGYLEQAFPLEIEAITIQEDQVRIQGGFEKGKANEIVSVGAIEVPLFQASHRMPKPDPNRIEAVGPREGSRFEFTLNRHDGQRDRATSRWRVLGRDQEGEWKFLSEARYADRVETGVTRDLEKRTAEGIKGLGGIPALDPDHEIFELGIGHATVNMVLNGVLSSQPKPRWEPWVFEGKKWYLNRGLLNRLDRNVRLLSDRGIVVSAILLVGNGRDEDGRPHSKMVHPEALPAGKFAMPNLAEPEGAHAYRAVIHLLTERYTRESAEHGRVSNWIIHNEIDQSGTWTTMGDQPLARYLETYVRSARLVHHSARRFDPHARIFMSLTHHWTKLSGGPQTFVVRDLVELFARAAKREGDFAWGLAYHPYPESLRKPRTWEDEVTFDFETPYITPRNIEVLPRFLDQPRFHFEGQPRAILFSEQGINAPSLSSEDQALQAAGIVYVMLRARQLPGVEAFHYHAYRDAPEAEGGLLLGLTNREHGRKQAWEVYRALGTEREAEAFRFAWPLLGVEGPEALVVDLKGE